MSEKIYRDSVHNIIRVKTDDDEGKLLVRLIDTAEFQRLRRIKQLGLALFAYQAAEHSRFTHSLGALHLATRTLEKLTTKYKISGEAQTAVRVAALLHDIGHGAFSHVIETILGFHHEQFSIEAVLSDETEVGQILREFSSELPENVAAIIRGNFRPMALAQLVSSQLDVDRMDYLLRDSLMTGAKYGIYDVEWIIKSLEIDEENDRLYVSARGIYAVEDYLQARYYMFRQVYFHRTLRSAESVLHSLLRRALELFKVGKTIWFAAATPFEKILRGEKLLLKEHLELDDADVMFHIKQWEKSDDKILSDLSKRFLNRKLFKVFDLDMPAGERQNFLDAARKAVENAGFEAKYYFIEDRAGDVPYYFYTKDTTEPKNLIYVEEGFSHPQIREISEVSAAVRGLQKGYQIHRVCFPPELKEKIARIYHKK
ncbi:MAG: HD domain-containing protein [Acidobacteria bacterium]|nr:HD domain-containing protein [Acidobacteriota bacterium]MCA1637552.1 HD domain-containing protein [Acidobacteriota bacterium]